jgi:hypothetical protein
MSELWILLGIVGNAILFVCLFVWGVLNLAKAIRDSNNADGL